MCEIIRSENGGDLTYFLQYYLELLVRALDVRNERQRKREQEAREREQETLRQERELARKPLTPTVQPCEEDSIDWDAPVDADGTPLPTSFHLSSLQLPYCVLSGQLLQLEIIAARSRNRRHYIKNRSYLSKSGKLELSTTISNVEIRPKENNRPGHLPKQLMTKRQACFLEFLCYYSTILCSDPSLRT